MTINNGFVMRAWYDITGFGPDRKEDDAGIRESAGVVDGYIEQQKSRAASPPTRIVIAGFSQGGAIALQARAALSAAPRRRHGAVDLSAAARLGGRRSCAANRDVPILMCHGLRDGMVPATLGKASRDLLLSLGYPVEWQSYPMEHQVCMEEVLDISKWLQARLARNL